MTEPTTEVICRKAQQIKADVDQLRSTGEDIDYPIWFVIDGQFYSFAACIAECGDSNG